MDFENCAHEILESGWCIECGIQLQNDILVDEFTKINNSMNYNKYLIPINSDANKYHTSINKVLIPLKLEEFKPRLLHEMNSVKLKGRISEQNRVLLVLYNILLKEAFPISINDLLAYSTIPKHRFLKIYRDSFSFIKKSDYYYELILFRAYKFIEFNKNKNLSEIFKECFNEYKIELSLKKEFVCSIKKHPNCDPFSLGIVILSSKFEIPISKKFFDVSEKFLFKLKNIKKMLKKYQKNV